MGLIGEQLGHSIDIMKLGKLVFHHSRVVFALWASAESCRNIYYWFPKCCWIQESIKSFGFWLCSTMAEVQRGSREKLWSLWRYWTCSTMNTFEDPLPLLTWDLMSMLMESLEPLVIIHAQLYCAEFVRLEFKFLFAHLLNCFTIDSSRENPRISICSLPDDPAICECVVMFSVSRCMSTLDCP